MNFQALAYRVRLTPFLLPAGVAPPPPTLFADPPALLFYPYQTYQQNYLPSPFTNHLELPSIIAELPSHPLTPLPIVPSTFYLFKNEHIISFLEFIVELYFVELYFVELLFNHNDVIKLDAQN